MTISVKVFFFSQNKVMFVQNFSKREYMYKFSKENVFFQKTFNDFQ